MRRPWLAPLVPLYAAGAALRQLRITRGWERVRQLQWPVVSVGNLSAGGAGKTPLTITLARLLKSTGFRVDVLSRGYGRKGRGAARVDPEGTAAEFGDEPLLIAREAGVPVYVAPRRYEAGVLAEADDGTTGQHVHILDDGFQHRQLGRDLDVLLLSQSDLRDTLLPAGNLREQLRGVRRAQVVALPAEEAGLEGKVRELGWDGAVWRVRRHMEVPTIDGPAIAFCGIARPQQFFTGLEALGVRIALRFAFRDHQQYTAEDMRRLAGAAQSAGAKAFITTKKDEVRLGNLRNLLPQDIPLMTASLHVEIENADVAIGWLAERLSRPRTHESL